MKITFMTLQKASIVCLGVGMFLALGSAGTFETTGEIQTGVYVAAFVFLLAAGLLMVRFFLLRELARCEAEKAETRVCHQEGRSGVGVGVPSSTGGRPDHDL